jgi:hypothetical protein
MARAQAAEPAFYQPHRSTIGRHVKARETIAAIT